jgi:tripartite-type tricarboxylate transporter receptor subunit TctC
MFMRRSAIFLSAAVLAACGLAAGPSRADEVSDFYKGKTITISIGYGPGGGYDTYTRAVARHIGKHIPGNPNVIVQNMPGAGSRLAANWLFNVAPKDGTALAVIGENSALDQALKEEGVQFDVAKFNWIGNPIADSNVTFVWASTGLGSLDDVIAKGGLICGGTGASSPSILQPTILNNLLNARIKIVTGYPGGGDVNLAMERNEVNCRGSNSWASTKSTTRQWLDERKINILVQFSVKKDPSISQYQGKNVPIVTELAKNETDRKALAALVAGTAFGRPLLAPPAVPAMRVAALRKAFDDTMKDAAFVEETGKAKMDLNPIGGAELQKVAQDSVAIDDSVVKRVRELIEIKDLQEAPAQPKGKGKSE